MFVKKKLKKETEKIRELLDQQTTFRDKQVSINNIHIKTRSVRISECIYKLKNST